MKSRSSLLLRPFVLVLLGGSLLSAQQGTDTVSVAIVVMDPSGAAVPLHISGNPTTQELAPSPYSCVKQLSNVVFAGGLPDIYARYA